MTDALLDVKAISRHLQLNPWQVIYAIQHSGLPGTKLRGPGGWGRGGAWRVLWTDYLDWLRVTPAERKQLKPGQLPYLVRQAVLADLLDVNEADLAVLRDRHGVPYRTVGRGVVLITRTNAALLRDLVRDQEASIG